VALVRKARILQGRREREGLTEGERMRIVEEVRKGWKVVNEAGESVSKMG